MATTFVDYTGDGNATKPFSFPSYKVEDIKVDVDGVIKTVSTHYNITSYTTTGGGNVVFTSGNIPASPAAIRIFRDTDVDSAKATYTAGSSVKAGDLNNNQTQLLYAAQEEQNQTILSSNIKDGAITSGKIFDGAIVNADVNTSAAIAGTKISPDFGSQNIATTGTVNGVSTTELAILDGATVSTAELNKLDGVTASTAELNLVDGVTATTAEINYVDGVTSNIQTQLNAKQPLDADLTTLAGMQSGTASKLADSTALTADIADLNQIDGLTKQTTISDTDSSFPTSGAVVDYVTGQIDDIGGFEAITNEISFPNSQPGAGVVISIADAAGIVVNGSGTSTTGRTVGGSTVTINNINSQFNSSTINTGVRFIVISTGSGQIYNYHKATLAESDLVNLSGDINDFSERYRVGSSNPTSSLDSGDLFFNTSTGKLLVYNGTNSAWEEAQSIGNFFISTFSEAFDGSRTQFTLSNAPTNAQQIILSLNGVVQKPGTAFTLSGSTITLASAPASGTDYFAVVMGSTVNIGTPSNNTVGASQLQNGAITNAHVAANAAIDASKISGLSTDKINEGDSKVEVVDTGSASHVSTEIDGTLITRAFAGGSTHFKSGVFGSAQDLTDGSGQGISIMYGGGTSNVGIISCTHTSGLQIRNTAAVTLQQNGFPNNAYASFSNTGGSFSTNGTARFDYDGTNINFALNVLPDTDSNYDIGTSAKRFANVYADTLYGDGSNLTGVSSPEVYGFKTTGSELQVTTTNGGADNISGTVFDAFEDVVLAATGFSFSVDANGKLIATI
jgi:hypothetical protein